MKVCKYLKLLILGSAAAHIGPALASKDQSYGYYPESYEESRARFLKAVNELRPKLGISVRHESFQAPEHQGSGLFSDFVYLDCQKNQGKASPLLLLTSGVHGTESKVGTAAQIWFLKNHAIERCQKGLSQAYFHALNPFGFHHHRRFTNSNVDLNRNFPTSLDIYQRENGAYGDLEEILNPKKPVGPLIVRSGVLFKKLISQLVGGLDTAAIRQASVGGQYEFPLGIYFGGNRPEPVVSFVSHNLKSIFPLHSDVLHYDFHTGLGEKGVLHMIVGPGLSPYGKKKIKDVFVPLAGQKYKLTTADDPGFYKVEGDLIDYVSKIKADGNIVSFTVEYGTVGLGLFAQLKTLTRLVNENQGHHHGYKNDRVKRKVKQRLKDLFHPPQKKWLQKVKATNSFLLTEVIDRFVATLK